MRPSINLNIHNTKVPTSDQLSGTTDPNSILNRGLYPAESVSCTALAPVPSLPGQTEECKWGTFVGKLNTQN